METFVLGIVFCWYMSTLSSCTMDQRFSKHVLRHNLFVTCSPRTLSLLLTHWHPLSVHASRSIKPISRWSRLRVLDPASAECHWTFRSNTQQSTELHGARANVNWGESRGAHSDIGTNERQAVRINVLCPSGPSEKVAIAELMSRDRKNVARSARASDVLKRTNWSLERSGFKITVFHSDEYLTMSLCPVTRSESSVQVFCLADTDAHSPLA